MYRLCDKHALLLPKQEKRNKGIRKRCSTQIITQPNSLWKLELKYGYAHGEKRFLFIMAINDVYVRLIVGYYIGLRCQSKDIIITLNHAIDRYNNFRNKLVIRSDNGTQISELKS